MEPIAEAGAQAPWQVWGTGQALVWGVPFPQLGAQARVQQQVAWVGVGPEGVVLRRDACSGSNAARPAPAVTACKERRGHELRRSDGASWPRAV